MNKKNKILSDTNLRKLKFKNKSKRIVLCHGVFDVLHIGHINYFKEAKKFGDILVVSITDDKFVNKGPGRPAFSISNRVRFLKEINCIDFIFVSKFKTSENVILNLKPNYYCKGGDYPYKKVNIDKNLEREIKALKKIKGKFKTIKKPMFSSSKIINDNKFQNFNS